MARKAPLGRWYTISPSGYKAVQPSRDAMRQRARQIRQERGVPTLRAAGYRSADSSSERPKLIRAGLIPYREPIREEVPYTGGGFAGGGGGGGGGYDDDEPQERLHDYEPWDYTNPYHSGLVGYLNDLQDTITRLSENGTRGRYEDAELYGALQTALDAVDDHAHGRIDGQQYAAAVSEAYSAWESDDFYYDPDLAGDQEDSPWKYHLSD